MSNLPGTLQLGRGLRPMGAPLGFVDVRRTSGLLRLLGQVVQQQPLLQQAHLLRQLRLL